MTKSPMLRATVYLFFSLFGLLLGGFFPTPAAELVHFLAVLLALGVERQVFHKADGFPPKKRQKNPAVLWLFPLFALVTLLLTLISTRLTVALGGNVPTVVPSASVFVGAVLVAPLCEELLFRFLLFRLLLPYGERRAVLFSALLFAIAHGSFFQFPYALAAGVLLALSALWGGSVLFPLVMHLGYNLLSYFSAQIPLALLLAVLGVGSLLSIPFLTTMLVKTQVKGEKRAILPLSPSALIALGVYTIFMLALALERMN